MIKLQAVLDILLFFAAGYNALIGKYDRATFYVVLTLIK